MKALINAKFHHTETSDHATLRDNYTSLVVCFLDGYNRTRGRRWGPAVDSTRNRNNWMLTTDICTLTTFHGISLPIYIDLSAAICSQFTLCSVSDMFKKMNILV